MGNMRRHLSILSDPSIDGLLKVAFATSDRVQVDQHFGSAEQFVIYALGIEEKCLVSVTEFEAASGEDNEDKLAPKLELLKDCIAVYCRACGASAIKQLLNFGVQPVKVAEGAVINELIETLQQELSQGPSAWLAKAVSNNTLDLSRFNEMEMNSWDE